MRAVLQQLEWINERDIYADNRAEMLEHLSATTLSKPSQEGREEAGMKLRNNHARVLKDVQPKQDKNIDGKPLTQLNLVRVDPKDEALADEALCED